jgi:energy-coupling factor transporter ATP-binding protein EcfA2
LGCLHQFGKWYTGIQPEWVEMDAQVTESRVNQRSSSEPIWALEILALTKSFDRRPAVDCLDLRVRAGEFYALLGPNGAGKTTTLKMVVGLLRPDAGSISVLGIDALADPVAAKQITAWISDEPMIYDKLTPFEYLEFIAGLWSVDAGVAEARTRDLLDWPCGLRARALRGLFQGHAAKGGAGWRSGAQPTGHRARRAAHWPRRRLCAQGQEHPARPRG